MHPEIVRDAPGSCPICGMALEPMVPSDEPSEELTDFTRRMWISAAAAVPLIILTMGELVALPVRDWIGHQMASYLEFVLATPIILWAALPFFRRGWDSIVNRSPNMWTLIGIGVAAAYLYSIVATFLPGVFPEEYRMGHGVGTYFEAAVVIVALVFVGQVLELRARTHRGCDPRTSGPRAENRAANSAGRHRIRRSAGKHHGGRSASRAPGRCCPCRRDSDRGAILAG
jgi:Cu+-exporting ATPase